MNSKSTKQIFSIGILGANVRSNNYGVRVLFSGIISTITAISRCINISIIDYGRDNFTHIEKISDRTINIPQTNMRFSWRSINNNNIAILIITAILIKIFRLKNRSSNPVINKILQQDVVLSASGGDSFSDIYGFRRFLFVALPQLLVILLGKPLVLLPQTYGPFKAFFTRIIAKYILKYAACVLSRDKHLDPIVYSIKGAKTKPKFIPDVGFMMEPDPTSTPQFLHTEGISTVPTVIGINVNKLLWFGGYDRKNMFGLQEDYQTTTKYIIEGLLNDTDAHILLIPHVFGGEESQESEVNLCEDLSSYYSSVFPGRVHHQRANYSHKEIKSLIANADFFIGARMHACIAALSQNIPTAPLAYSDKFKGALGSLYQSVPIIDLRILSKHEIYKEIINAYKLRASIKEELDRKNIIIKQNIHDSFKSELLKYAPHTL